MYINTDHKHISKVEQLVELSLKQHT